MKVIYIAGKYRDPRGEFYVLANILEARHEAVAIWKFGGVALCPHLNTALFGGAFGVPDETWLKGDLELLLRCDAVYAIPGWESSSGARQEVAWAKEHNIPVFTRQSEVINYIETGTVT